MTHSTTLGEAYRKLIANGYAPTSETHPDRIVSRPAQRDSFIALSDHPAAIFCRPTYALGCELEDAEQRQVALLVITGYLISDARQWKAVQSVLEGRGLLAGPVRVDSFGNRVHVLRYSGSALFDGEASARLTHDADDATVFFQHAIAPGRYAQRTDAWGRVDRVPAEPVGSHVLALDGGEWKGGDLLSTPRDKLPELRQADVNHIILAVEDARWGARPAALAKDAA